MLLNHWDEWLWDSRIFLDSLKNQCLWGSIQHCSPTAGSQDFPRILSPCSHHGYLGILPRDPHTQKDALSFAVAPWGLCPEATWLQEGKSNPGLVCSWFMVRNPQCLGIPEANWPCSWFSPPGMEGLACCPQPFSKSYSFVAESSSGPNAWLCLVAMATRCPRSGVASLI